MRKSLQSGEGVVEGITILAVIILILLSSSSKSNIFGVDVPVSGTTTGQTIRANSSRNTAINSGTVTSADYEVELGSGNASYAYQSYDEYITIANHGDGPVNITGWQLKNGKDERPYYYGGALQRFSADVTIIPQATLYVSPTGNNTFRDVVLQPGERAIVTTGSVGVRSPYQIVSFKENMCSGYIERLPDYAFTPSLSQSCPDPEDEPGVNNLDIPCRKFISSLSRCETPKFDTKDRDGYPCNNCIKGETISSHCAAFIKERYNYGSCVATHQSNPKFHGKTWRIFLGRGWEMWDKEYETIELFDRLGQLIDFKNY